MHRLSDVYNDLPLKEVEVDESNPDYEALYEAELYNYKVIRNLEAGYSFDEWNEYYSFAMPVTTMNPQELDDVSKTRLIDIYKMRTSLKQLKSAEDLMWYIWGDNMPTAEGGNDLIFEEGSFDNNDFRPYIVPYMLEDQSNVKGNLILVSGGGFQTRANESEGFPAAKKFNELGYNCFLLQRRVAPYGTNDIFADLQRALRYIRYHQDELKLGATDHFVAVGWSGGAATVLGTVAMYYGDVQPNILDKNYVPDEIDKVNSDFDVVIPVYGASYDFSEDYTGLKTENNNLPAFFISMGADDPVVKIHDAVALFNSVKDKTEAELHIFSQNAHGYGVGKKGTNSQSWPELADQFIQQAVELKQDDTAEVADAVEFGEVPSKYTKKQTYLGSAGFGTAEVTLAVNDDETAYFMYFEAFGLQNVLAGIVHDGEVMNRYDRTKQFSAAAQALFDGHDENAWEKVE